MWGAIAGAALGIGSSIFGAVESARQRRKVRKNIQNELAENEAWYNRRYNEDGTQRADAQRILTLAEQKIRDRNRAAAGAQAVMGGTEASAQATKAANAQTLADATAQIAANADARKDQIESQYHSRKDNYEAQLNGYNAQTAQNISTASQGVAQAAGTMGQSVDEWLAELAKRNEQTGA